MSSSTAGVCGLTTSIHFARRLTRHHPIRAAIARKDIARLAVRFPDATFLRYLNSEDCIAHRIGTVLVVQTDKLFAAWHRVGDGRLTCAQFETAMRPMRREILALLREGASCGVIKVMSRCKGIYKHRRALFTFARVDGVEPTNIRAERALRHGVILRKTSFGTHSATGSRFLERMLTVTETLRQRNRDVHEFLVDAVHAHFKQARSPSLLPS